MEELKECPFCGGKAENRGLKDFDGKIVIASIVCKKCGAQTRQYSSENGAKEAWNNRV